MFITFRRAVLLTTILAFPVFSLSVAQAAGDAAIVAKLQEIFPEMDPDSVEPAPIAGLYQMTMGTTVLYVSADGRYLFQGDILDMDNRTNLTDKARQKLEARAMAAVLDEDTLIFAPEKTKYKVTVFTDIDCGYCRKLHREMGAYHKAGIAVRYMFYPRAGLGSDSAKKLDNVWCAADRHDALTKAKAGKSLPEGNCETPVAAHYELGRDLGLRGTPFIITDDGQKFPGYLPAKELLRRLEAVSG